MMSDNDVLKDPVDAHARDGRGDGNAVTAGTTRREPSLVKQKSTMEITGIGGSKKKASLYLTRSSSQVKSGQATVSTTSDDNNNNNKTQTIGGVRKVSTTDSQRSRSGSKNSQDDVISTKKEGNIMSREFTFTGYDIMADCEPVYRPEETGDEPERRRNVQYYRDACRLMSINPISYLCKHLNDQNLVMKSHPIGPEGARALCVALVQNSRIQTLDLEDNDLGPEGAQCVVEMLQVNEQISELFLAENNIGSRGMFSFVELIRSGRQLHTLDLSGSNLDDTDSKYVADIIEFSPLLRVFNCRNNRLGDNQGGFDIGRAMAINDTLKELDISWNHIRGKGALAVALGLQKNVSLKKLNLSWNGFATDGSEGLGRALVENRTLLELDITNNRIGIHGVAAIIKGLQQNEGLITLRIGQNPYSPEVAQTILQAIDQSDKCVLTTLDLSDIAVRTDFLRMWEEIKSRRVQPLRIMFGAVVKSQSAEIKETYDIDWQDPVVRMFKFMQDKGYRVIDLLKRLDKDRSFSVDRNEFKQGLIGEGIPMTEAQLDEVIDRLDKDGDGEVDLSELLQGEKEFKKKMRARMRRMLKQANQVDANTRKLMDIAEL